MKYRGNLPRFFVFWSLANFYLWLPIWVIFLQQRGLVLSQIGTLDAIGWVVMAAVHIPAGAVADTYGRRTSMLLGAVLNAVAMFAVTAKVLSPIFLVGYLLWGSSWTFIGGADMAFLYDSLKADGRLRDYPKVTGRYMAAMHGSQALASLIGAWLATYDMRLCFLITGVLKLVAAGVAMTFREPPRTELGPSQRRPGYWQAIGETVRVARARPTVRYLVLFGAISAVFPYLLTFVLVQPYARAVGFPVWSLGGIVLAVRGSAVLGSMLADRVLARSGAQVLLIGTLAIMVLAQGFLGAAASQVAVVLFLVVSLASALARPVLSVLLNEEIPSAQRATILSLQSLVWTVLLAVFEPGLFTVASHSSLPFAIGLSSVILAGIAMPLLVLWRRSVPTIVAA